MARLFVTYEKMRPYAPLIRLALLAAGLLVVALAGGAPGCLPDGGNCP